MSFLLSCFVFPSEQISENIVMTGFVGFLMNKLFRNGVPGQIFGVTTCYPAVWGVSWHFMGVVMGGASLWKSSKRKQTMSSMFLGNSLLLVCYLC